MPGESVVLGSDVAGAKSAGRPIVALETTIFSELGLPRPHSVQALGHVTEAVAAGGAVPALTAVIDGEIRCGLDTLDRSRICGPATKMSARDIGRAVAQKWSYGATTVSAAVTIAAAVGVEVFATGGIGGVHRNAAVTGDISADLGAIAARPVVTVTAGAKVFLDLERTVEHLETLGVPVLGWHCDEFPAFHSPTSGVGLSASVTSASEAARIARAHWELGGGGIVVACPIPDHGAINRAELDEWVEQALARTGAGDHGGADVTPAVLGALAEISGGRTVEANLVLAENNAVVAAAIAGELASDRVGS
ncbi:MAG: pseudouridine-5'-phosphate glycosidase [Acidimicrobiia bacterium]|nr:pseudouridine-5'-phosphate glycosidase [Acidimicrobiia bacterium]